MRELMIAVAAMVLGASAAGPSARVTQVAWLAGCWEHAAGPRVVEEQWTRPRGGLMLGSGRTVRGDTLLEYEQTRIFERGGRLIYGANPSGQTPAEFESIELSDSSVTFENPMHDFPQRVMYRRRGADSLIGRVEGMRGGKLRGVDFPYTRVDCP